MPENLPHRTPATTPMQAQPWEGELPSALQAAFPALKLAFHSFQKQNFVEAPADAIVELLHYLRDEQRFDMLTDLTAVDRPSEPKRFEVIYILYSFGRNQRVRIKIRAALDEPVASAAGLYAAADWLEREVFDMFGIVFHGHPNLKRILLPEDWNGFPLRKEASIVGMDNEWVQRNLGIESGQS